ncbi:peptide chain release factor N(5)-glutamine methyltransferase [Yaniella sp.]|uniref:peptide chain release factor N(5)-glutamine methyltransferase n=1 Tax=Yaniella sp. TaxID=2773929 RepID=UPI00264712FA|nr:peptide chain release factor N(5)-glutamine methyltransferase [Yaniella sp.]MDN6357224.1 peptide chain release factor N(5)-glutamine methyltransferase [Yaniella sp.]
MTEINQVIQHAQRQLFEAGIDSAKAEAAIIVAHVLEVERGKLGIMQALGERLTPKAVDSVSELVEARVTRTPLQYLTGTAGFYGLDVQVEPGVFIPRVETEILVETTLQHFDTAEGPLKILDLCTGTGAIAAALAEQLEQRNIPAALWAVDLDPAAADLARRNTAEYNVTVLCADATDSGTLLAAADLEPHVGVFDAVVTNPPYIPTATPVTQPEAGFDPQRALYGGSADGTSIPLAIADQALQWLAPGGFFIMEHDHTHASELAAALEADPGWQDVVTVQDLTQTNRFVSAIRTDLPQPTPKTPPTLAQ